MEYKIDFSEVIEEFSLTAAQAGELAGILLDAATQEIYRQWKNAASKGLGSTRRRYIAGLTIVEEGRFRNSIVLKGKFNNGIETGMPSFDIKIGLGNSPKAKHTSKGGWYISIPFRWASSDAIGENEAFSGVMPPEVYKAAKLKNGAALTASDLPAAMRTAMSNKTSGYKHKSSLYEGIRRSSKVQEEKRSGKYVSFRRVSDKSDARAFIHPGIQAKNFAQRALSSASVETVLNNAIDNFLK